MNLSQVTNEDLLFELFKRHGDGAYMQSTAVVPIGKDYSATLTASRASMMQLHGIISAKAEKSTNKLTN